MTTIPLDHGRITTQVSLQMRETLTLAAEMTGTTINQFIIQTAMREAERVIEQERVIRLSARDTASFLDALDNPQPPNAILQSALNDHASQYHAQTGTLNWTPRPKRV